MRFAIAATLLLSPAVAEPEAPLNVIVFLADDLGWMDLGCQGSTFYETPNLDSLAASGVRFTQGYAACGVCSPTRVALMTGKAPGRLHTTDYFGGRRKGKLLPAPYTNQLPAEEVTLAEALKEAGYRTGFFGKWHLGGEGSYPEDHGFDLNVGGFRGGHPPKGYFSPYGNPSLSDGPEGEFLTERLTVEACRWMEEVSKEPFLLYMSYYMVHTPLQARPEDRERFLARREALPERSEEERWGKERARKVRLVQDHAVYAGMVWSLDESVGQILSKLNELGLEERTLVLFTSDNGGLSTSEGHPTSNLPLRAGKGWLYEGGIREPFLVRWPGVTRPGSTTDAPAISMDVYPTILAACGLDPRPRQHCDGVDLTPILRGEDFSHPRTLFWHYPHYGNQGAAPGGAIRDGDWKLVEWFEDGTIELFHLGRDIGETQDLAAAEPAKAAELHAKLIGWRAGAAVAMPSPNPDHGGK